MSRKTHRFILCLTLCFLFVLSAVTVLAEPDPTGACKHNSGVKYEVIDAPTCTEPGLRMVYCKQCSKYLRTEKIPATGHKPGKYQVTKKATCTSAGKEVAQCSVCGAAVSKTIPAKGHLWEDWEFKEISADNAVLTESHRCKSCRKTETQDFHLGMSLEILEAPEIAPGAGKEAAVSLRLTNTSELSVSFSDMIIGGISRVEAKSEPAKGTVIAPGQSLQLNYLVSQYETTYDVDLYATFRADANVLDTNGGAHWGVEAYASLGVPVQVLSEPAASEAGKITVELDRVNSPLCVPGYYTHGEYAAMCITVFNDTDEETLPFVPQSNYLSGAQSFTLAPHTGMHLPFSIYIGEEACYSKKLNVTSSIRLSDGTVIEGNPAVINCDYDSNLPAENFLSIGIAVGAGPANGTFYAAGEKIPFTVTVTNVTPLGMSRIHVNAGTGTAEESAEHLLEPGKSFSFTSSVTVTEAQAKAGDLYLEASAWINTGTSKVTDSLMLKCGVEEAEQPENEETQQQDADKPDPQPVSNEPEPPAKPPRRGLSGGAIVGIVAGIAVVGGGSVLLFGKKGLLTKKRRG